MTSSLPEVREKTEQVRSPLSSLSSHCRLTEPEPRDRPRVLDTGIGLAYTYHSQSAALIKAPNYGHFLPLAVASILGKDP